MWVLQNYIGEVFSSVSVFCVGVWGADEWVSGVCVYYKAVWVCVRGSCVLSSVGVFSLSRKTRNLDELHARILIFFLTFA